MGDGEWKEVSRKKKGSVFHRLQFPQPKASSVDDLAKISHTVYVSNFPSHLTMRELWNICGEKGTLVDVFIAKHKNKLGQMFAFCRFIKVVDMDTLINSLSNVWIGKLRLHANVARFERKVYNPSQVAEKVFGNSSYVGTKAENVPQVVKSNGTGSYSNKASSYANVAKSSTSGGGKATNSDQEVKGSIGTLITLSQDNSNDYPLALLGCYNDFRSIANTRFICQSEGFMEVEFRYLGGLWVLFEFTSLEAKDKFLKHKGIAAWFSTLKPWHDDFVVKERLIWLEIEGVPLRAWTDDTFKQICSQWGELLFIDDTDGCNRLSKRLCIKSPHALLVFATIMVSLNDVTYAIRVRELCSWTPTFVDDDSESDEEGSMGKYDKQGVKTPEDNDVESVADLPDNIGTTQINVEDIEQENEFVTHASLNQDSHVEARFREMPSHSDPFDLASLINKKYGKGIHTKSPVTPEFPPGFSPKAQQVSESFHKLSDGDSYKQSGFSMLQRLEETIKVGMALGLNMEGCEKTLASLVADNGELLEVSNMANVIGCGAVTLPFKYLGVPMGCNMARCANWSAIFQKFSSKLSLWKAQLLSVGGRLSLIKSVLGNLPTYYMSIYKMPAHVQKKLESMRNNFFLGCDQGEKKMTWVKWKKCLASKKLGGLGIGSILGLTWGFYLSGYGGSSTWDAILSSVHILKSKGIDLLSYCIRKVGNGVSTRFWNDIWIGDQPLNSKFPRIYMLDNDRDCYVANRIPLLDWSSILRRHPRGRAELSQYEALRAAIGNVALNDHCDSWQWSVDVSSGFSVASVRSLVDARTLDVDSNVTRWYNLFFVPKSQKPRGLDGTLRKIDRIMANLGFLDSFAGAHAIFQPYRVSDHSPAILHIPTTCKFKPRPFKFSNILVQHSRFKQQVQECWGTSVSGFHMFKVVSKLKALKKPFRRMLFREGNIHENVTKLRHGTWDEASTPALGFDRMLICVRGEGVLSLNAFCNYLNIQSLAKITKCPYNFKN
ncbi:reverse transcriptase domain, Reverse transcriptase zinc-binding domain protein [Artemisia annua]|uniref:Reverse transcriptase domain, Reverse transcriptase zinc-binding domain protein n=1 Tax=Artemisia annua TaxID=35608 RepID=A0A2U1NST0_ARTAN|nr:reverse transcriptase domain, Reverse transcriptase zinc-binding domain protein [Artemisia annua]